MRDTDSGLKSGGGSVVIIGRSAGGCLSPTIFQMRIRVGIWVSALNYSELTLISALLLAKISSTVTPGAG